MYRLLLWDTAGQEKFRSLIPAYLRDASCAVFVYDVLRENSFDDLTEWIQMFDNYKRKDSIMVIVGNKIDIK
jgi:Ras-related protein Rab-6A